MPDERSTTMVSQFLSTPWGSLITHAPNDDQRYVDAFHEMPGLMQNMLFLPRTAAYIRGLARSNNIPLEQAPRIAFAVMRAAVGDFELAKLAGVLSGELKLANDVAQRLAQDIEKELFIPIMRDFNEWITSQKQSLSPGAAAQDAGAQNVVDLKNKK